MVIQIESLLAGAARARGVVVVIDVFRAFTTACLAFRQGAERIVLFERVDHAQAFAATQPGSVLLGEVDGAKPAGFDFGNSPAEIDGVDFTGKTLVQSTRAGTTGVTRTKRATQVLAASLQNARATAEFLMAAQPDEVTLVAMGWAGEFRTEEDELCALYIRNLVQGHELPVDALRAVILASKEAQKFGDPRTPQFAVGDLDRCLAIDAARYAIRVEQEQIGGRPLPVVRPVTDDTCYARIAHSA